MYGYIDGGSLSNKPYIQINLKYYGIVPNKYMIKHTKYNHGYLRNWSLYGYDYKNNKYIIISNHINDESINKPEKEVIRGIHQTTRKFLKV